MVQNDANDPKGLIREAYRIPGITAGECRSIFLDWALSIGSDAPQDEIRTLLALYGADTPEHPMTVTLTQALEQAAPARRRGGRAGRMGRTDD